MKKEIISSPIGVCCVKATLDSGLQVFIVEKKDYDSAYALFGTKYGSIDTVFSRDGENFTQVPEGIAHFLEHKLFESEDGDAFTRYAETGAYANAFTSFDRTCYLFSCSDSFEKNLEILLDFVQSPYFTAETVKKEQGIIGQEIRMYEDSPSWRVLFNMLLAMYQNHPVRIDIAGTVDSIAKIDDKLLYECYNTFYHPSNMFICIAGNVDANSVLEQIEKGIKKNDKLAIIRGEHPESDGVLSTYTEQNLQVAQPLFCYGFKLKTEGIMPLFDRICFQAALDILAGDNSDLFEDLMNKSLINDEFDTEVFCGNGYASVIFSGESGEPEAVKNAINREIARLIESGIDDKIFEAVKRGMYGDAVKRFNSVQSIGMQLCEAAVSGDEVFGDLDKLSKITKQDVTRCLKQLKEETSVLSVVKSKE